MKRSTPIALLLFCCFVTMAAYGQTGTWTWMHGSNTANSSGSYGTKGVAASTNEPPGRYQCCYWTDLQGNFWVFGGAVSTGITFFVANDLWKYDVGTNMWTWVNGPNCVTSPNPSGVYGTKGIPSSNNFPSARGYGANCWTDTSGNLWLYGGSSGGNDLWKYTISTNQWTWVNGNPFSTTTSLGVKGIPAASNTPGSVTELKSAWVDESNHLWMFGGQAPSVSDLMWKYDIATNMWTWINGGGPGNYGTYRVESASNLPPARASYTRWKDASGNMYLFGGAQSISANLFNDVWRYRPDSNRWTWVSGSNSLNYAGAYPPQKCVFYDNYFPRARFENQTAFSNYSCNKAFWTFGGFSTLNVAGGFNDLWLFETDSFRWSWISGSSSLNSPGVYGTKGIGSAANEPAARGGHGIWMDNLNNLWIFGGIKGGTGSATGYLNDLWRFQPDTACLNLKNLFAIHLAAPDSNICLGDTSIMIIGPHTSVVISPGTGVTANTDSTRLWFSPRSKTSYTVVVNGGGCRSVDTVRFTINPQFFTMPPHQSPDTVFCAGNSSVMHIGTHKDVLYYPATSVTPNADTSALTFAPLATTAYTVITQYKCSADDTVHFTIHVTQQTYPHHAYPDTVLCLGDTTLMNIGAHRSVTVSPPTALSYSTDSSLIKFFPAANTAYTVVVDGGGCSINDTMHFPIRVIPRDTVKLTGPARLSLCAGDTIIVMVKPQWTISVVPAANVIYKPAGDTQIIFKPASTTMYTIFAKDDNQCAVSPDSLRFTLTILPNDQLSPFPDTILCAGDTSLYTLPFRLSAFSLSPPDWYRAGSDGLTYRFFPPRTTSYQFIGIKPGLCGFKDTLNFTIHRSTLSASFDLDPRQTELTNPVFRLTNTSRGAERYAWFQNNLFLNDQFENTVTVSDTGNVCFMLVATDDLACADTATECGRVINPGIYIPTAFSPNGDGRNEIFKAIARDVRILELAIYNRFGERVFVSYINDNGWDGTYHGKNCELGTYFYLLRYSILDHEPVVLKGDLTLIR